MWQLSFYVIKRFQFMYPTNLLFGKRVLWWTLFFLCLIGLSGATSALVGATPDGNVAETPTSAPPKHSPDEQHWAAVFESPRPLAQDWRQYAASDALKPELQTPARIVLESVKAPLTEHTPILLLTLQANNIQVRETWRVSNSMRAFTVSNNGELYLTVVNKVATFVATVYLIDNFQALNKAYQNLTASAVITVDVMSGDLSAEQPPRLTVLAGVAKEVYVFKANGGDRPYTYTLLENPDANAFTFSNGTLAININATSGEYRFTVAVADADNMSVTVAATVEVIASLSAEQPPRLTVVGGVAKEVYVFEAHGGSKPYTYTLLANPAANAFAFSNGTLAVNVNATSGEYRFTVAVADAANRLVTVAATVEVVPILSAEQPPRLVAFEGMAKEVYVFEAHGGIRPYTYTLLENPDTNVFTFSNGALAVNVNATSGEYRFTVEVADATNRLVTVAATVEVRVKQIFVLGGLGGSNLSDVWFSADGANWRWETDDAEWAGRNSHQAVSHNGRLYVLGGSSLNDVWSSADSKNWERETDDAEWAGRDSHQAVSHNGRLYVLGGRIGSNRQNDVWSSADGKNWEEETAHAGWAGRYSHQAVSQNGRLYVLGGYDGDLLNDVWSSADGKNWVRETDDAEWAERYNHQAVSQNGRLYVLGGDVGSNRLNDVWSSADGKSWVRETDDAKWAGRDNHQAVSHSGRLYVLGGRVGSNRLNDVWSSADGKNWSLETAHANWTMRSNHQAVVFPSPLALFGVGERLTVSAGIAANLHTFTAQYGKGNYTYSLNPAVIGFAVSPGGVLEAKSNAATGEHLLTIWVEDGAGDLAQTAVKVFVPYLNLAEVPLLVGLAGFAKVLHTFTTDGGIAGEQYMIVAGNTEYFALDADSGVLSLLATALEGVYTLSVEVSDSTNSLRVTVAVTVNIGRMQIVVLGGRFPVLSDVWFSADGKNWRRETDAAEWGERYSHQALSHNGRLYVLGGIAADGSNRNDVWSSADGANWSLEDDAEWAERWGHQALSHNGRLYVLGGNDGSNRNDVWSSADGANWSLEETAHAKWAGRFGHQAVSHNGRLYVLGGYAGYFSNSLNDVWSSADGKNWSRETDGAEWAKRADYQALSHNGRIYVLGGLNDDSDPLNDVWSSADGKNWSREPDNAKWTWRWGHQAVSHSGRLYVLGGYDDEGPLNDVWSSADGKNWSRETANANWVIRYNHQAVVFPSPLALFGVGERLTVRAGIAAANLHTFTAQYGKGNYTYSLNPVVSGFAVSRQGGVLSAGSNATVGEYTLTVWVEDGERNRAQTALRVTVVAQSTAQSHPFSPIISPLRSPIISPSRSSIISPSRSPIISPSASGGGASALALAGGALSLLIIPPPASSLSRPRTPPTSAEGENRI